MICPQCKNEKLDEDICHECGLSEKEALKSVADTLQREGRTALAIEFYQKYLLLDPDSIEVLRKKSSCLCLEAMGRGTVSMFDAANEALMQTLHKEWGWEKGHQFRVDLFSRFGKLADLREEYENIARQDAPRKESCEDIVKIIKLTEKFKNEPPAVLTELNQEDKLFAVLKNFWPLFVGAMIGWVAIEVTASFVSDDKNNKLIVFLLRGFLGFSLLGLLVMNVLSYRKNKDQKNMGKK